ncbi:hypothetical protein WN943_023753 [Citrus x changshan-huyou]
MVNFSLGGLIKIFYTWNLRVAILLSLSIQTVLLLFAPFRKGTGHKLITLFIWLAYLLAHWSATYCVGVISENQSYTAVYAGNIELLALWPSFLLLHLGGSDTITSFGLEDNELWLRHLLGYVFQAAAAVYIFFMALPNDSVSIPTILLFIAGTIKYVERTRALYLASLDKFRDSMLKKPDSKVEAKVSAQILHSGYNLDYLEVVHFAYLYFNLFKGFIVDLIFSFNEREQSRAFFDKLSPEDALRIIEVQLNFIYGVLHTKIRVMHSVFGCIFRFISFGSIVAALSYFYFAVDKYRFVGIDVGITYTLFLGAIAQDVVALFMLVFSDWTFVALGNHKNVSRLGEIKSSIAATLRWCLVLKNPQWQECHAQHSHRGIKHEVLATPFLFRRWSGSVSGHSLIRYWLKARPSRVHKVKSCLHLACENIIHYLGIDQLIQNKKTAIYDFIHNHGIGRIILNIANITNKAVQFLHISKIISLLGFITMKLIDLLGLADIVDKIRINASLSHQPLTKELWVFIFEEIKRKARFAAHNAEANKRICSAKGEGTLQELGTEGDDLVKLMSYSADVSYDESLLLWHIATQVLYYTTEEVADEKTYNAREFSKMLSDYMLYLLVLKPTVMNSVASIAKIRLQDTSAEAERLFKEKSIKPKEVKKACESILNMDASIELPQDVKEDKTKSVLFDGSMLAKELEKLEEEKKWDLVSKVWVELLSSAAASQCSARTHAQQVSIGGELITFVWVLMTHFGLGEQFHISNGRRRAEKN